MTETHQPLTPSSGASSRMSKVRQTGTGAELALRKELYKSGLRYRINFCVMNKPRRIADIAFPRLKIAIFVDGCFWHGCPEHATWPKHNAEFWQQKIKANQLRDADTNERLQRNGWSVLRFWEHESPIQAAEVIAQMIRVARVSSGTSKIGSHQNVCAG